MDAETFSLTLCVSGSLCEEAISRNLLAVEATWWRALGRDIEAFGGSVQDLTVRVPAHYLVVVAMLVRLLYHIRCEDRAANLTTRTERVLLCYLLAEEAEDESQPDDPEGAPR